MRLSSPTDVLASAERVIQYIISAYSEPNLAPDEIQPRVAKGEDPLRGDPLREFSNICRAALEVMQNQPR